MRYAVIRPEVWGNAVDGWDVNDQHHIGTLDIEDEVFDDDASLMDALNAAGYLDASAEDVYVDDEEEGVHILDISTGRPLLMVHAELA